MHTTLDHLEKYVHQKPVKSKIFSFMTELKVFLIIFMSVFLFATVFTNAEMFVKVLNPNTVDTNFYRDQEILKSEDIKINNIGHSHAIGTQNTSKSIETTELFTVVHDIDQVDHHKILESQLKNQIKNNSFDFNTLPPENRLIISKIGLDVPLIDSRFKNRQDLNDGNFDTELFNGVVKYPTTPNPGTNGNSLIFGHTSQEWRKQNYYSTVFIGLTEVEAGDTVNIIWDGKLHEYNVEDKVIIYPSKVNEEYDKYHSASTDYITLMGCYPIGKSSKRILVIAKRVN